jgi:hypothetical protein
MVVKGVRSSVAVSREKVRRFMGWDVMVRGVE